MRMSLNVNSKIKKELKVVRNSWVSKVPGDSNLLSMYLGEGNYRCFKGCCLAR